MELKQAILVRQDLKLPKGKMSAQVAHASVEAVLKSSKESVRQWRAGGMKKIVLKVKDLAELHHYHGLAEGSGLVTAAITDAGHTTVPAGTTTCLAIGPDNEDRIDRITGNLKIM